MQYPIDQIDAKFHMIGPIDRAIIRNTHESSHRYIKYGYEDNQEVLDLLEERSRVCSIPGIEEYIRNDDVNALPLILRDIGYTGSETPIDTSNMPWIHFAITSMFCMKYKAIKLFTELFNHEYYRRVMIDAINKGRVISMRADVQLFTDLCIPSEIFTLIFSPDSWMFDAITQTETGLNGVYESIMYGALRRRDYTTIDGLCKYEPKNLFMMDEFEKRVRGKPGQRFIRCSRIMSKYPRYLQSIQDMKVTKELLIQKPPIVTIFSRLYTMLLTVAKTYDLYDEVCGILCNLYGDSIDGDILESLGCDERIFPQTSSQYCIEQLSVCLCEDNRKTIRQAIYEDNPRLLLDSLIDADERYLKYIIEEIFPLLLFRKADFCLRCLLTNPETEKIVKDIAINGFSMQHPPTDYYGSGIIGVNDETFCDFENSKYIFLLLLAGDIPCFTTVYDNRRRIAEISQENFNEFRYMLALGAVTQLNDDVYCWTIDELYGGNEENFIAEMYLRSQLQRDKYNTSEHTMLGIFRAFKLFQLCDDYMTENE